MKSIIPIHSTPHNTIKVVASDLVQAFEATNFTLGSRVVTSALITCEDADIRFTCGITSPSQTNSLGHLLIESQSIKLSNSAAVRNFKFINATNGSNATLQVTFEFEIGA